MKFLEEVGFRTRSTRLDFGGDLHLGLDLGMLFVLHIIALCIKSATLPLFTRCHHYNGNNFSFFK